MRLKPFLGTLLLLFLSLGANLHADTYWLQLLDKAGTTGDLERPLTCLTQRALDRRQRQNLPLDSLDLPVSQTYCQQIRQTGADLLFTSRWNNSVTVHLNDSSVLDSLIALPFVTAWERTQSDNHNLDYAPRRTKGQVEGTPQNYYSSLWQAQMINLLPLHAQGFQGQGMQIAVIDDGFYRVPELSCFEHTTILDAYDFVEKGNSVYAQGDHGCEVLSTMAAVLDTFTGTAPQASFYLFRTEDDVTESLREMDAMIAAFERADSLGADIVTASLGYAYDFDEGEDLEYSKLDGRHYRNSIAATVAARKGMLLCIAMGNEGTDYWYYLSTPADADSIVSVGGTTLTGAYVPFSSHGPSADGRVKPEVCALAYAPLLVKPSGVLGRASGTSFATPIVAGALACLWQALPDLTNMEIRERAIRFASQYEAPDDELGYGVLNVWDAYQNQASATPTITNDCADSSQNALYYDLQGRLLGRQLQHCPTGLYIQRTGDKVQKVWHQQ